MLRERDSRVAAPEDVLATLAELDAKLEALERGMAAAQGSAAGGRLAGEHPVAAGVASEREDVVVADFQAAARSRTERGLWRRAITDGAEGAALAEQSTPPVAASEFVAEEPDGPAAEDLDRTEWAVPAGAAAGPAAPPAYVAVPGYQLSDWRERLRRAMGELTTLQAEIETSAVAAEWPTGPATSTPTPVAPIAGPIAPVSPADVAGGPASAAGTPAYGQVHSHPARVDPATPAAPDDGPPAAAPGDGSPAAAPGNGPPAVEPGNGPPVAAPVNGVPAAAPGNGPPVGARLPVPMPHDRLFEGRVLVDAGPFVDIAGVAAFQRALELVPGASAVDVTALELDRAHLELELSDPVALGREIRAVFPFNFAIFEAGHGRLSINVDASSQTARQAALGTR